MDQHRELLALAGRAPDGWLVIAREALADRDTGMLTALLAALDKSAAKARRYEFAPEPAGYEAADRALVDAIAKDATACWVTMRDGTDRVYLVQADDGHARLAAAGQRALQAFENAPRVEVFGPDHALPAYHERALLASTLLWSATPEPAISVARTFDGAGADGPWFAPDHEMVVDSAQRRRLLDFLAGGEVVLAADLRMTDVLTGTAGAVPVNLRSDGTWVWSEASRYYLDRYQLAPDAELVGHALTNRSVDRLTPLTRHHVRAALNPNDQEGPSWRAG